MTTWLLRPLNCSAEVYRKIQTHQCTQLHTEHSAVFSVMISVPWVPGVYYSSRPINQCKFNNTDMNTYAHKRLTHTQQNLTKEKPAVLCPGVCCSWNHINQYINTVTCWWRETAAGAESALRCVCMCVTPNSSHFAVLRILSLKAQHTRLLSNYNVKQCKVTPLLHLVWKCDLYLDKLIKDPILPLHLHLVFLMRCHRPQWDWIFAAKPAHGKVPTWNKHSLYAEHSVRLLLMQT